MSPQEQTGPLFAVLKKHLKERRLTYREIASRIGMSEASLKRIFSTRSCSLSRFAELCSAADLSLSDVMAKAARGESQSYDLPLEAERYFVRHFDCFILYRRLSSARDLDSVIRSVAPERRRKHLDALERLGLLSRGRSGYRLRHSGYLRLRPDSELRKKVEKEWIPWLFERLLSQSRQPEHLVQMFSTGLTRTHRLQLEEELAMLLQKYRDIGLIDQRLGRSDAGPVALCVGMGPYRVGHFEVPRP